MEHQPLRKCLSLQQVERLERLLGGDNRTEEMVLRFIAAKYGAQCLCRIPESVAKEIVRRPGDFLKAVKQYCEPELPF